MTLVRHASPIILFIALLAFGCVQRPLAVDGGYRSDQVLWQADGVIIDAERTFDEIEALAARNASYVQAHSNVAAFLANLREHRAEWMRNALVARKAYAESKTGTNLSTLQGSLDFLRNLLGQARQILNASSQPQP